MTKVAEDEDGRGGTVQFLTFNEEEYNEVWILYGHDQPGNGNCRGR